jgi:hypothetical protein
MGNAQVRDFLADRREFTIGDEGDADPLVIVYRPGRVNSEYNRRVKELSEGEHSDHKVAVYSICTIVSDWNLTGPLYKDEPRLDRRGKPVRDDYGVDLVDQVKIVEDGEKIPLKSEYVRYLATPLLLMIIREIGRDMAPDPKSGTTS